MALFVVDQTLTTNTNTECQAQGLGSSSTNAYRFEPISKQCYIGSFPFLELDMQPSTIADNDLMVKGIPAGNQTERCYTMCKNNIFVKD